MVSPELPSPELPSPELPGDVRTPLDGPPCLS